MRAGKRGLKGGREGGVGKEGEGGGVKKGRGRRIGRVGGG